MNSLLRRHGLMCCVWTTRVPSVTAIVMNGLSICLPVQLSVVRRVSCVSLAPSETRSRSSSVQTSKCRRQPLLKYCFLQPETIKSLPRDICGQLCCKENLFFPPVTLEFPWLRSHIILKSPVLTKKMYLSCLTVNIFPSILL